jgi:hypothetical protein
MLPTASNLQAWFDTRVPDSIKYVVSEYAGPIPRTLDGRRTWQAKVISGIQRLEDFDYENNLGWDMAIQTREVTPKFLEMMGVPHHPPYVLEKDDDLRHEHAMNMDIHDYWVDQLQYAAGVYQGENDRALQTRLGIPPIGRPPPLSIRTSQAWHILEDRNIGSDMTELLSVASILERATGLHPSRAARRGKQEMFKWLEDNIEVFRPHLMNIHMEGEHDDRIMYYQSVRTAVQPPEPPVPILIHPPPGRPPSPTPSIWRYDDRIHQQERRDRHDRTQNAMARGMRITPAAAARQRMLRELQEFRDREGQK